MSKAIKYSILAVFCFFTLLGSAQDSTLSTQGDTVSEKIPKKKNPKKAKEIEEKYLAKETELYQEEKKPNFETTNSKNTETIISYIKRRRDTHYLQSDLVFALGLNQLLEENILLEDTRFEFIKSWFAEVGWSWKTNIIPNSGLLNLRYGVSIQINSLSPKDNQIFY